MCLLHRTRWRTGAFEIVITATRCRQPCPTWRIISRAVAAIVAVERIHSLLSRIISRPPFVQNTAGILHRPLTFSAVSSNQRRAFALIHVFLSLPH